MQGWGENDRGVSFTFGSDVVTKFLSRHDLDLVCRAHQVKRVKELSYTSLCVYACGEESYLHESEIRSCELAESNPQEL